MKSISTLKSGVLSRLAGYLQYSVNPKYASSVAGQRPIGGPSATQTDKEIYFPTVQSAIDDIAFRAELPVGTIITNSTGIQPGFISQVDQMKFTGAVTGEPGSTTIIKVFGLPVEVSEGDQPIAVAQKVFDVLTTYVAQGFIISEVTIDAEDASILNIKYNDYQNHIFAPKVQKGTVMTQTTIVEPSPGYGTWSTLGTQQITLAGGTVNGPITLYYFRRES